MPPLEFAILGRGVDLEMDNTGLLKIKLGVAIAPENLKGVSLRPMAGGILGRDPALDPPLECLDVSSGKEVA
ncbi:hypothetical protein TNCV_4199581 [Trichonephila clavipes]|uniref:Uncharacterized protein n=1 Tax=Trichonephila clavipes TaxID=2585209 RepID=A0A8X6WBQ8_TRICX|nr:hypothetical protein TNCV_4199581 [Trichonephila clavipes]